MHDQDEISNHSDNPLFGDIVTARASRRRFMAGSLGVAALTFVGTNEAYANPGRPGAPVRGRGRSALIGFTSIPLDGGPMPKVAPEYELQVLIPWREKLDGSGESYAYEGFTAEEQENSIGIGHDGMWLFPKGRNSGVLCINFEYGTNTHIFGAESPSSLKQVRLSQAAHGVGVVALAKNGHKWAVQRDRRNRRIHVNTPVQIGGLAAGSPKLATAIGNRNPKGTVNN